MNPPIRCSACHCTQSSHAGLGNTGKCKFCGDCDGFKAPRKEQTDMAKAKSKTKSTKGKSKSGARVGDRLANAKKIGERQETITRALSPMEVDREREEVCKLLREIDKAEEERKNEAAAAKAKITELKTRLAEHARVANTAKRDEEITIEEWLTDKNEVIRVRADNGEIIGNRVARAAELQEDLPLGDKEADDDEGDDAEEGDADGEGDDSGADFGADGETVQ